MTRFPQVLLSVRTGRRADLASVPGLADAIAAAEDRLGDRGRVLVRASGTEPVVRVMVEAATAASAESEAEHLVSVVRAAFADA
jgi:phosphoglucosamine mutase